MGLALWIALGFFILLAGSLYLYQRHRLVIIKLEHALRTSEARLHSFFDATPDALLISDALGTITMANKQVEKLLGYVAAELLGRSIEDLVPSRYKTSHPRLREEFTASPRARRMGNGLPVKAIRKDGSECDVEVSLSRIETEDGFFLLAPCVTSASEK